MKPQTPRKRLRRPAISRLYGRALVILGQEINHLVDKVKEGKLSTDESRNLASYIRLLKNLRDFEEWIDEEADKKLGKMSLAEVEDLARRLLKKGKKKCDTTSTK